MAEGVNIVVDEVILDGELYGDEITIRFKNKNGKMTKKVLVVDSTGTIHVYENEAGQEDRTVRLFRKPIKVFSFGDTSA